MVIRTAHIETQIERLRVFVRGAVQGVGFRPFVYRLARGMGLNGWVVNSAQGVVIEVEGTRLPLEHFLLRLEAEKPPRASIQGLESSYLDPVGLQGFAIRESELRGEKSTLILPDIAICNDCLREVFDPSNRRYLYPFTNCTNCGPRFTIVESLPYDRPNTSMKAFDMCEDCRREYDEPADRRFHAQPNACPACGPHVELWDERGNIVASRGGAMDEGVSLLRRGGILAVKGLGGFHLIVLARDEEPISHLRRRKRREEKPFALMYPSIEMAKTDCEVSELEERLLRSAEAPIVLLRRRIDGQLSDNGRPSVAASVAPANPYLGVMLPYTPLHHILMHQLNVPVVATSGNVSDEPICTNQDEALARLQGIADMFLVHNRPIVRHVDDSVARVVMGRELILRRARGYAPMPVPIKSDRPLSVLAVGAHLKNTVAISRGDNVFLSQHIGDLETEEALDAFKKVIRDFQTMYELTPDVVACDLHPEYLSTKYAMDMHANVERVQHHYAHVAACMAENELDGRVLGVSWDGTGYGLDGTVWGGEFLLTDDRSFRRIAALRRFRLPGSGQAIKEPRRSAIGLLYVLFGDALLERMDLIPLQSFSAPELRTLLKMTKNGLNSPLTSSVGRLFDALASIVGLRQVVAFEGQAAMEIEYAAKGLATSSYPFKLHPFADTPSKLASDLPMSEIMIDWTPLFREVLEDVARRVDPSAIAAAFHRTLCEIIVRVAEEVGEERVVLTGGCFQNRILTEGAVEMLRAAGFRPYWHQRVPPNDGGIALGQVNALLRVRSHSGGNNQHISTTRLNYGRRGIA